MLYVTTSRKPSQLSKRLGKAFALLIPFSNYENRGKKSIDEVVERARKLGKTRVLLVYEYHSNPSALSFISIGRKEEWEWLTPELAISKLQLASPLPRRIPHELLVQGTKSSALLHLLASEEPVEGAKRVVLEAAENSLTLSIEQEEMLKFSVSYKSTDSKEAD
ncbi:MAG: hypothetical protein ABIH99_04000 [Candidatus Micrarchaeota archaeon]